MSDIIQVLKNYRFTPRDGSAPAVRAIIEAHDERDVPFYRFVSLTAAGGVVELVDFPQSWGIWMMREHIAACDDKSSGRWSREGC